ncbi:30S ribosomal protein S6 [Candidatus Omnitrophota bacterium]
MNKYEAMVMVKGDLSEEARNTLLKQVEEQITKNKGEIESAKVWAEKFKMVYKIKKIEEALYYLMNFQVAPGAIDAIKKAWRLNDEILRFLILRAK